jgi:predicted transcriptional regulator
MLSERAEEPRPRRLSEREKLAQSERSVLRIARTEAGRLTPSLVVVNSNMSLEEAEKTLESLVSKGHAVMLVQENGRIVYEFSEFLPKGREPDALP